MSKAKLVTACIVKAIIIYITMTLVSSEVINMCSGLQTPEFDHMIYEDELDESLPENAICEYFANVINTKNTKGFQIILELALGGNLWISHLLYNYVFYKTDPKSTNNGVLGRLVYVQWKEGIEMYLSAGIVNPEHFMKAVFIALEYGYTVVFDSTIECAKTETKVSYILLKICYHMCVKFGNFDQWIRLLPYWQTGWWTPEECLAECQNPINSKEHNFKTSRHYRTRNDLNLENMWNPDGFYFEECVDTELVIKSRNNFVTHFRHWYRCQKQITNKLLSLFPVDLSGFIQGYNVPVVPKWCQQSTRVQPIVCKRRRNTWTRCSRNNYLTDIDFIQMYREMRVPVPELPECIRLLDTNMTEFKYSRENKRKTRDLPIGFSEEEIENVNFFYTPIPDHGMYDHKTGSKKIKLHSRSD